MGRQQLSQFNAGGGGRGPTQLHCLVLLSQLCMAQLSCLGQGVQTTWCQWVEVVPQQARVVLQQAPVVLQQDACCTLARAGYRP